jgi:hypothetical protein
METGEAGDDGLEPLADGIEMVQSLLEMKMRSRCDGRCRVELHRSPRSR